MATLHCGRAGRRAVVVSDTAFGAEETLPVRGVVIVLHLIDRETTQLIILEHLNKLRKVFQHKSGYISNR